MNALICEHLEIPDVIECEWCNAYRDCPVKRSNRIPPGGESPIPEVISTYSPSDDILKDYQNLSHDQLMVLCGGWINTAAQHLRNEDYWRARAFRAEGKTDAEIKDWGH